MDTHLHWSRKNAKLKATEKELREIGFPGAKILGFGIPALRSKDGFNTCPFAGACAGGCYAREGFFRMPTVADGLEHNLNVVRSYYVVAGNSRTPTGWPAEPAWHNFALKDLAKLNPTHVRLHTSGDFFDVSYLDGWTTVARARPDIMFYGYTKRSDARASAVLNWHVVQSEGGTMDHVLADGRPHARVFESEEALAAAGYENCAHTDTALILGAERVGLVLHGQAAKSRTENLVRAGWVHR